MRSGEMVLAGSFFSAHASPHSLPLDQVSVPIRAGIRRIGRWLAHDWQGRRYGVLALSLVVISSLVVLAYYLNHPRVEISADTPGYTHVAKRILTVGDPVDAMRTPGYPSLIALVFWIAGNGNLAALSVVQGVLFVLTALEIYSITALIVRRAWVAFCVGLMVGANTYLMAFAKAIVVESFALWLVASLTLAAVLFVHTLRAREFWLVALFALAAFMTRPEWVYVPIPLFAYLLFVAARRARFRCLLPHALLALVVLYGVLGLFIYQNAKENGCACLTFIQRLNMVGKVLQYHMQDEATPEYTLVMQKADALVAQGSVSPYRFAAEYPEITAHDWKLGGDYAFSVIAHHPVEFFLHTIPILLTSSMEYNAFSHISPHGPFLLPLLSIHSLSGHVYKSYQLFPLFALFWVVLLLHRRTRMLRLVEAIGVVLFLAVYDLLLTSLGGFVEYWRLHIPFDPLVTVVIWGTLGMALALWGRQLLSRLVVPWRVVCWVWGTLIVGGLSSALAIIAVGYGPGKLTHLLGVPGVHLLAAHPLRVFVALSVPVAFTLWNVVARRRGKLPAKTGGQKEPSSVDEGAAALFDGLPEHEEGQTALLSKKLDGLSP